MYADGWHVVTLHKRGRPFDQDRWELYRPEHDFNEMQDLATQHPDKVKELERRWYEAAKRYDVLPLDDRNFWLKIIESRRHSSQRAHWEFRPPLQPIASHAAPLTGGRSHSITAEIERPTGREDGVLVAYGSRFYGYALYVQGGHLVYEIGLAPRSYLLRSDRTLPSGSMALRFAMEMIERPMRGIGRLFLDGTEIGRATFDEVMVGVPYDGLDIGADRNAPVSGRYAAPFAFQGRLRRVAFDVDTAPPTEDELRRDARMIQMMS
jgi:arylsulfatase